MDPNVSLPVPHAAALRLMRFIVSGGTATALNVVLVYVFTEWFDLWYLISAIIAYLSAIATSFLLQKLWTFEDPSTDRLPFQTGTFLLVAAWGLLVNEVVVFALVEYLAIYYVLAQLIAGLLIAFQNYFAYAYIFKRRI